MNFVKGIHPNIDSIEYGYLLKLVSIDDLNEYIEKFESIRINKGFEIYRKRAREAPDSMTKHGHFGDEHHNTCHNKSLDEGKSFFQCCCEVYGNKFAMMLRGIIYKGFIYVAENGACVPSCREISEIVNSDIYPVFEEKKWTRKDISIKRWPNGHHFYVKVGIHEIPGLKTNTIQEAEEEGVKLLRKLQRKKKK